jgi:hypothetical protein
MLEGRRWLNGYGTAGADPAACWRDGDLQAQLLRVPTRRQRRHTPGFANPQERSAAEETFQKASHRSRNSRPFGKAFERVIYPSKTTRFWNGGTRAASPSRPSASSRGGLSVRDLAGACRLPHTGSRHPRWRPATSTTISNCYALGRLVELDAAPVEEHLLVCKECPGAAGGVGWVYSGDAGGDAPGRSQSAVTPPFSGRGPLLSDGRLRGHLDWPAVTGGVRPHDQCHPHDRIFGTEPQNTA